MEYVVIALCLVNLVCMIIVIIKLSTNSKSDKGSEGVKERLEILDNSMLNQMSIQRKEISDSVMTLSKDLREQQVVQQNLTNEKLKNLEDSFATIRKDVINSVKEMEKSNTESLDKINGTVNEKLQKTLDDKISKSFEAVNKRLAEVYQGLGEMKNVASGVSDLKNVLANVKTRGIMGEIQLGAILGEILAPEQYAEQICVVPKGAEKVDFAVRLPGAIDGESVLLPIDSKFPGDTYSNLVNAYESGDVKIIAEKKTVLAAEMKRCAKSIHDKYIQPPYTTDFAIMFLPFEGLYAEVVNMGLVEILQHDYKVNIAGPSTMAAMLNSLQMGFKTLAIQKKSGEVWKVLEAAKKEFGTFSDVLEATRDKLRLADKELDKLIGVRTRAINRKLSDVSTLDTTSSTDEILGITSSES